MPERVVSLVPSITETLILFGVIPEGRSSFCVEPKDIVENIPRVGGTKTPNINRIEGLAPDLVIANLEENTQKDVQAIQALNIPVWVTFPNTMRDTCEMLQELSQLSSGDMPQQYVSEFKTFLKKPYADTLVRVLVLIWKDPWMAVGTDTYTHHLIEFSGGMNACLSDRYPTISQEDIIELKPDVLLLPCEPYLFTQGDVLFWQELLVDTDVRLFSGEDLFWSGQRAINTCQALSQVLLPHDRYRVQEDDLG